MTGQFSQSLQRYSALWYVSAIQSLLVPSTGTEAPSLSHLLPLSNYPGGVKAAVMSHRDARLPLLACWRMKLPTHVSGVERELAQPRTSSCHPALLASTLDCPKVIRLCSGGQVPLGLFWPKTETFLLFLYILVDSSRAQGSLVPSLGVMQEINKTQGTPQCHSQSPGVFRHPHSSIQFSEFFYHDLQNNFQSISLYVRGGAGKCESMPFCFRAKSSSSFMHLYFETVIPFQAIYLKDLPPMKWKTKQIYIQGYSL